MEKSCKNGKETLDFWHQHEIVTIFAAQLKK